MLLHFVWIAVSLVLLYFGAEWLVRGSSSLALRLGMSPLVVGLTVVALGTSAPEVLVSVKASLSGYGALAIGNVIGSNIFNIAVILGITAVVAPMRVRFQLLKIDAPIMLGIMLLVPWVLWDGVVCRFEGLVLVVGIVSYVVLNILAARRTATPDVEEEFSGGVPPVRGGIGLDIVLIGAGLTLLIVGARLLTDHAVAVARELHVEEAVIGLTIVAFGTSIPELATAIIAALRREPDLALGNVIGSNIFNVLGILGVAALCCPLSAQGIQHADVFLMVALAAALIPLMWTGMRLQRLEGAFLLAVYAAYIAYHWPR